MIRKGISNFILLNLLLYYPPGDNLKGIVDENTIGNTFSSTLTILFRLTSAVILYLSSAVKFSLFEFFSTFFNYGVALRARIALNPIDKTVE